MNLEKDETIIIKTADKGGATVIMHKTYYGDKILELLTDAENYKQIRLDNYQNFTNFRFTSYGVYQS